jgi:hypothetical protein
VRAAARALAPSQAGHTSWNRSVSATPYLRKRAESMRGQPSDVAGEAPHHRQLNPVGVPDAEPSPVIAVGRVGKPDGVDRDAIGRDPPPGAVQGYDDAPRTW